MRRIAGITLALLTMACAASAQSLSLTAGYQLVHILDETFPLGFNVDVGVPVGGGLAVVGEAGFAHDNRNEPPSTATSNNLSNFGAGLRFGATGAGAFVQVIAGGVHTSANVNNGAGPTPAADTAFMLQPGIGIAAPVARAASVVVQGDYRRAFFKEEAENEFRLFLGVRIIAR